MWTERDTVAMYVCIMCAGEKSCDEIWSEHVRKDDLLLRYSHSMHILATSVWSPRQEFTGDGGGDDRIAWCIAACNEYFLDGRLVKLLQKDLRRLEFERETVAHPSLLPQDPQQFVESTFPRPWSLLDVGSCYNPFSKHSDLFTVTAVDIAPACEVRVCVHAIKRAGRITSFLTCLLSFVRYRL